MSLAERGVREEESDRHVFSPLNARVALGIADPSYRSTRSMMSTPMKEYNWSFSGGTCTQDRISTVVKAPSFYEIKKTTNQPHHPSVADTRKHCSATFCCSHTRPTPTAARTNGADVGEVLAPGGVSTKMDKAKERQQQQPFFTLRTFLQNIVPSDEESPTSSNHTASHSDVVAGGVIGDRSEGTDDVAADAAMGAEQVGFTHLCPPVIRSTML